MREKTNTISNNTIKLLTFFIVPALLIFSVIAITIFYQQKNKIIEQADNQARNSIPWLVSSVKIDVKRILDNNNIANNTLKVFLSENKDIFSFNENKIRIEVIDFYDKSSSYVEIRNWRYRNDSILKNSSFIKPLSLSLNDDIAFGQKTKKGYVVISSTLNSFELSIIPFSSKFIYTIENGDMYNDVVSINNTKYYITASPLYINGEIQGFYANLTAVEFSKDLNNLFLLNQNLKRGYPFAMDIDGNILIHPLLKNTSIHNTELYKEIINKTKGSFISKIDYNWPETKKGEPKTAYVKYIPELQLFISSTYYYNDLKKDFNILKYILFLAVFLSTLAYSLALIMSSKYYNKKIAKIDLLLNEFEKGRFPSSTNIKNEPFHVQTAYKLADKLNSLKEFSNHLVKQNYSFKYNRWSKYDTIGTNLIELNTTLLKKQQEAIIKTKEQEKLVWLNNGLSKFIEILKYQVIEIHDLAYKITSQIVEYTNANEGGFFIVNENKKGKKQIELLAAYAMHKEKLLKRKIQFGEGLIGRVAIEKKMLFITEIPDDYSKISTSLGEGKPKSIVIIPMLFNKEIIGVIELASLKVFTELQLEFLERISENISANLAMWRASQQTAKLLKESQLQAKIQQEQQSTLEKHLKELEKLRENSELREIELNSIIKAVDTTALLVEYDITGEILSANNRFLLTLGKDSSEIIGKNHKEITSINSKSEEYYNFWNELLAGKTKRFIESFDVQDRTIWLSQNYVPIIDKNKKVFKILNIAIDVTENKILERQLRSQVREISKEARLVRREQRKIKNEREEFFAKEKAYQAIISGADKFIGHIEFTIDGKIIYVNNIFGKYLGFDNTDSMLEKNIRDLIYIKEIETFKLAIENIKIKKEYSSAINFYNSKGNPEELEYTILPALDSKNKIHKIIMLITKN